MSELQKQWQQLAKDIIGMDAGDPDAIERMNYRCSEAWLDEAWNPPAAPPSTPGQIDRATFTDAVEALVDAQRTLTGVIRDNNLADAPKAKARVDQARARLDALVEPFLSAEGA